MGSAASDTLRGIALAIAEANKAGGVNGRQMELVVGDDHGTGEEAARLAERYVRDESILAVVGHRGQGQDIDRADSTSGRLCRHAAMSPGAVLPGGRRISGCDRLPAPTARPSPRTARQ